MSSIPTSSEPQLVNVKPNNAQENVRATFLNTVDTRRKTIGFLNQIARDADHIEQSCGRANRSASIVGVVGGGFVAAAGVVTIASDGLAAEMVTGVLGIIGAFCCVGGGVSSRKNNGDREQRLTKIRKRLKKRLTEDADAVHAVEIIVNRIKNGDFGEPEKIFREVHMSLVGAGGIGMTFGSTTALEVLSDVLPAVSTLASRRTLRIFGKMFRRILKVSPKPASEGMEAVVDDAAAAAVKSMPDGLSKDLAKIQAVKVAAEAYTRVSDEAAGKVAEMAGEEAAAKAAKEAATKAAKEAATQAAKTAGRVTGSVCMLFGVGTALWETYNAYQYHLSSKKDSELGTELRDLANKLENALNHILSSEAPEGV